MLYFAAFCSEFLGPKYFDVIDEGYHCVLREVIFLDMREYCVGDFTGTYNLDFYVRGFSMARTFALRSRAMNGIKCKTGPAKIMDFFRQAIFYVPIADNDYALHRNSFCHGAFHFPIRELSRNIVSRGSRVGASIVASNGGEFSDPLVG